MRKKIGERERRAFQHPKTCDLFSEHDLTDMLVSALQSRRVGDAALRLEDVNGLLKSGAKADAQDEEGRTPLHWAAIRQSDPAIVKALVHAGASPKTKDGRGQSARDYAKERRESAMVAVLGELVPARTRVKKSEGASPEPEIVAARQRGLAAKETTLVERKSQSEAAAALAQRMREKRRAREAAAVERRQRRERAKRLAEEKQRAREAAAVEQRRRKRAEQRAEEERRSAIDNEKLYRAAKEHGRHRMVRKSRLRRRLAVGGALGIAAATFALLLRAVASPPPANLADRSSLDDPLQGLPVLEQVATVAPDPVEARSSRPERIRTPPSASRTRETDEQVGSDEFNALLREAEGGSPSAATEVAMAYAGGVGIAQDYGSALSWLQVAATRRHEDSYLHLAMIYFAGEGVPQDAERAVHWLRQHPQVGSVGASMTNLDRARISSAFDESDADLESRYAELTRRYLSAWRAREDWSAYPGVRFDGYRSMDQDGTEQAFADFNRDARDELVEAVNRLRRDLLSAAVSISPSTQIQLDVVARAQQERGIDRSRASAASLIGQMEQGTNRRLAPSIESGHGQHLQKVDQEYERFRSLIARVTGKVSVLFIDISPSNAEVYVDGHPYGPAPRVRTGTGQAAPSGQVRSPD